MPTHAVRLHEWGTDIRVNSKRSLFGFVLFEEFSRLFEGQGVSVDLEFVCASVVRDRDDVADGVAVLAEGLDDQIDVYHG